MTLFPLNAKILIMKKILSSSLKLYLYTAAVISAVFLSFCAMRGVMPFGDRLLGSGDFVAQSIPILHQVWDFLHGRSDLYFNWNIGLGSNYAGTLSHYSLVSPFSLFFLLIPRSAMQASMIWYTLIKLIAMGCTFLYFLQKDELLAGEGRLPGALMVLYSAGYALSGYCMQYYGFSWIDLAVFFPLLMLELNRVLTRSDVPLLKNGFSRRYLLYLTLMLVMNIPQAYAICIYLILYAGGVLLILRPEKKRAGASSFVLLSLLSLGLSAVLFLPQLINILRSYRASMLRFFPLDDYYRTLLTEPGMEAFRKWTILKSLLPALIVFAAGLVCALLKRKAPGSGRKNDGYCVPVFRVYVMLLALWPFFVESTNVVYANGYYSSFPMRYGFVPVFLILALSAAFMKEICDEVLPGKLVLPAMLALIACWSAVILMQARVYIVSDRTDDAALLTEAHAQIRAADLADWSVRESLPASTLLQRTKLADACLRSNFPFFFGLPSVCNYDPLNSAAQIYLNQMLGYSQVWDRMSDTGGSVFSDALLQQNLLLSKASVENEFWKHDETAQPLYRLLDTVEGYEIRSAENRLPEVLTCSLDDFVSASSRAAEDTSLFGIQNTLYRIFFTSDQGGLLPAKDLISAQTLPVPADGVLETEILTDGSSALYLYGLNLTDCELFVDDVPAAVPNFEAFDNRLYPALYNDRILCLGSYDAGRTVRIKLVSHGQITTDQELSASLDAVSSVQLAVLDLDAFRAACSLSLDRARSQNLQVTMSRRSVRISLDYDRDGFAFFPVYTDPGWRCRRGTEEVPIGKVSDSLMMLPVTAGHNEFVLTYTPDGFTIGAVSSALSLIILAALFILGRRRPVREDRSGSRLEAAGLYVTGAVSVLTLLLVMIIPALNMLFHFIR